MPAWQTSWPRLWRPIGGRTPSWQNRRNAVRTRSPASGARRACSPPRPRGRTNRIRYRQLFRLGERAGCRVRREFTVLRQNAAVTQPLPINCGGSTPISAGIQVLTYISIGFLSDIIYAAGIARVDHNMLSIRGTWAHDRLQTPTGWRVLPTGAPFVLSPQSGGIMGAAAVETARDGVPRGGRAEPEYCGWLENRETHVGRTRRNKGFT